MTRVDSCKARCGSFCAILLFVLNATLFLSIGSPKYPRFRVESASVSIDNIDNNTAAAEWDLVVLARNPKRKFNFNYRQFDVYIQSVSQDWLLAAKVGPFRQGSKNTTIVNAKVKTSLPDGYRGGDGMVWDLLVMVRAKINGDKVIEAFCRNMKIVFAQNATQGQLVSFRESCPVEMTRI